MFEGLQANKYKVFWALCLTGILLTSYSVQPFGFLLSASAMAWLFMSPEPEQ